MSWYYWTMLRAGQFQRPLRGVARLHTLDRDTFVAMSCSWWWPCHAPCPNSMTHPPVATARRPPIIERSTVAICLLRHGMQYPAGHLLHGTNIARGLKTELGYASLAYVLSAHLAEAPMNASRRAEAKRRRPKLAKAQRRWPVAKCATATDEAHVNESCEGKTHAHPASVFAVRVSWSRPQERNSCSETRAAAKQRRILEHFGSLRPLPRGVKAPTAACLHSADVGDCMHCGAIVVHDHLVIGRSGGELQFRVTFLFLGRLR